MSPATGIGRAEVPTTPLTRADCWTRLLAGFTARARHPVVRRIAIVTRQRVIARHALKLARAAVSRVVRVGIRHSYDREGLPARSGCIRTGKRDVSRGNRRLLPR